MEDNPVFTDGRTGIADPIVECLNIAGDGSTYQRYEYLSDSIDREANETELVDADKSPLGGDTREGFEKGAINVMVTKATHHRSRPGHIIHLDIGEGDEYYRAGKFGRARTRHEGIKGSIAVVRCYNPIIVSYLSEAFGQRKLMTQAAGALAGAIVAVPVVVNTRAGGTLAFSMKARPGFVLPGWLSIDAATGALSGISVAGHWKIDIIVTETVPGLITREGFGILDLTIT